MGEPLTAGADSGRERRAQTDEGRRRRILFDVLHSLERTASTGVLHLAIGGQPAGSVLVHEGRVCFAVAEEAVAGPPDGGDAGARARLGQLARAARERGETFCAAVMSEPDDAVARLRAQLLRETAAALHAIGAQGGEAALARTLEHARADYDPRLTFSAAEVYCAALACAEPAGRDLVTDVFDGFQLSGDAGVLMSREPGHESTPYPIASYGLAEATLPDLLGLCRCAGELMRPSEFLGRLVEPTYAVLRGERGRHWVCVGNGRRLALIERHDGADLAPVIAQALRAH